MLLASSVTNAPSYELRLRTGQPEHPPLEASP